VERTHIKARISGKSSETLACCFVEMRRVPTAPAGLSSVRVPQAALAI
jgi:hypothetical protein